MMVFVMVNVTKVMTEVEAMTVQWLEVVAVVMRKVGLVAKNRPHLDSLCFE